MVVKDKYADEFVGIYKELEDWHKKALQVFSRYRFDRILDIGCGDGRFSILLKEACKAKEVYGLDISEKGVNLARQKGVKAFQMNIDKENLPFEDNYFDAVYAGEVIEHLFDPDHFLEEVYRVLKEGGSFVISTRNLASLYNRILLLFGFLPNAMQSSLRYNVGHLWSSPKEEGRIISAADHIRLFTYRSLVSLLKIYGFNVRQIIGLKAASPAPSSRLFKLIDDIISKFPRLSAGILAVCEKGERI